MVETLKMRWPAGAEAVPSAARDSRLDRLMFKIRLSRRCHSEAATGAGGAPPLLDEDALARLRQLDPDGRRGFLTQVLQTYAQSLDRHLLTLADAAATNDIRRAGEVAHTLKSSSASVGALALSQCCATVERLARANDAAATGAPMDALRAEAQRVLAGVQAMLVS